MKISIWWSGKTRAPYNEIVNDYLFRIKRFHSLEIREFKMKKGLSPPQSKKLEGEMMLKAILPSDLIYLLDDSGKSFTSAKFSEWLDQQMQASAKKLIFIIGGPFGFIESMIERAEGTLSLSKMTFPHDMVRMVFLEQIYRAFSIKNNLPYHHE